MRKIRRHPNSQRGSCCCEPVCSRRWRMLAGALRGFVAPQRGDYELSLSLSLHFFNIFLANSSSVWFLLLSTLLSFPQHPRTAADVGQFPEHGGRWTTVTALLHGFFGFTVSSASPFYLSVCGGNPKAKRRSSVVGEGRRQCRQCWAAVLGHRQSRSKLSVGLGKQ